MHPYSYIPSLVKPPNSPYLDAYHHAMMAWPPPKTMIPPLILPHDLIHLGISPPLGSNHLKGLAPKKVLQNNIAKKKISNLGS